MVKNVNNCFIDPGRDISLYKELRSISDTSAAKIVDIIEGSCIPLWKITVDVDPSVNLQRNSQKAFHSCFQSDFYEVSGRTERNYSGSLIKFRLA